MMREILDIIVENTRRRGSPVPIPERAATGWADGLNIPFGGDTVIYTGLLYQMIPYLNSFVSLLERVEGRGFSPLVLKAGKAFGKLFNLTGIIGVSKEERMKQLGIVRNIAKLLMKAGISFGYLYGEEMYSGVLLHDLGLERDFEKHAVKVYRTIRERGVKKIITIDPHTTNVMRSVYPKYMEFDLEVQSYLELLPEVRGSVKEDVVIHDSCVYARLENVIEQPRNLLSSAGFRIIEPKRSRDMTFCCGGPVESLFPSLSGKIARLRADELRKYGEKVVVMCPICLASLSRAGLNVEDISGCLARSLEGKDF
jgi:Fe-S oxidoreductase